MNYRHNYLIDIIFAVILVLVIGYGLKGTLAHMDEVKVAREARAVTETELPSETEIQTQAPTETEPETEAQAEEYEVVGGVNFRAQANGDSDILDVLPDGAIVQLIDKDNGDWWHVIHEGQEGYIYFDFLKKH